MIPADSSVFIPLDAKAVDASSVDVDLTVVFAGQSYARAIYNGNALPKNIAVTTLAGSTVTYPNVPSGCRIYGLFATLKHTGTTASAADLVAEK